MIAPVMTTNIVKCDSEIEIFINFFSNFTQFLLGTKISNFFEEIFV